MPEDQLELEEAPLGDHRVAGVVPALVADHEVHPVREVVDGLALALVPPLRPEHVVAGMCPECIRRPRRSRCGCSFETFGRCDFPSFVGTSMDVARRAGPAKEAMTRVTKNWKRSSWMIEIDGEYCVPHELNEARHVVDWGPFEPPRGAGYIIRKLLLFIPAMYLFILAVQIMKTGAAAIGPEIQGQFPFANGISTLGFGWLGAYFVLSGSPVAATAISLYGAGTLTRLQTFTMLSRSRLGASFIVLLTGFLYAARNPERSQPERADRDGDPGDDDDGARLPARDGHRLRDHPDGVARRVEPARVRAARGRAVRRVGTRRRHGRADRAGHAPLRGRAPRDPGVVQGARPGPPTGRQRLDGEASNVDASALDDVRAGLHRGDADPLGLRRLDRAHPARGEGLRAP